MTSKERILAVLCGEIPDRVPITLFVQEEYLNAYYGRTDCSRVIEAVKLAQELGFDALTRDHYHIEPHFTRQSYPNWEVDKRQYVENGIAHRLLTITTPKGVLTQDEVAPYDPATIGGIHFTTKTFLLSDLERDYEIMKRYMPAPTKEYMADMKAHADWAIKIVGDHGLCAPWGTGGTFNTACTMRALEDLVCDPYDDEDLYAEMMGFITDILARDYALLAECGYDLIGMQGNMANGGMLSCDYFRKNVMPYEERIIDAVHSQGKYVLYHNCGLARGLYPAYADMHMDVFETLSPRPMGDNSLAEGKALLGQTKVLSGNLDQVYFLKTATPEEVFAATKETVLTGKPGGRYLFACSDFLEKGTPKENVLAMIQAAREFGAY